MASRRRRGATCLVATNARNTIVASAECSYHEFCGTRLGHRRLPHAVLYITEVAVHPSVRRQGWGRLLLRAMDVWGRQPRKENTVVETLYLHVDVENRAAIQLYEQAGYQVVDSNVVMFEEFTRSLNLHPGATKGRRHHLMYKDLVEEPTWLTEPQERAANEESRHQQRLVDSFGFEIPA